MKAQEIEALLKVGTLFENAMGKQFIVLEIREAERNVDFIPFLFYDLYCLSHQMYCPSFTLSDLERNDITILANLE